VLAHAASHRLQLLVHAIHTGADERAHLCVRDVPARRTASLGGNLSTSACSCMQQAAANKHHRSTRTPVAHLAGGAVLLERHLWRADHLRTRGGGGKGGFWSVDGHLVPANRGKPCPLPSGGLTRCVSSLLTLSRPSSLSANSSSFHSLLYSSWSCT
jgi:hypothetical protein